MYESKHAGRNRVTQARAPAAVGTAGTLDAA
jgi:hypothetical protein